MLPFLALLLAATAPAPPAAPPPAGLAGPGPVDELTSRFIEAYFAQYPTLATEAGRADFDDRLEDAATVPAWLQFMAGIDTQAQELQGRSGSIDLEVLRHQIAAERFTLRRGPPRDPLYWTGICSRAVIYLLLRDDQPRDARIAALTARARQVPRLLAQAQAAVDSGTAPELVQPAARQSAQLAELYATGLNRFAGPGHPALAEAGTGAAKALRAFSAYLKALRPTGSARLGADYAEAFRLGLRTDESPALLLPRFQQDLVRLRREAAAYGKSIWPALVPGEPPPADEKKLLRRLFAAIEDRHDTEVAGYTRNWQSLVPRLESLVRARNVIALPEPRTLKILAAPPYLSGQAYGGVFPAGPFRPDGETLLLLPVPPEDASLAGRVEFFRAFNRPFSTMIAAHEALPGHYVQLKIAAHQPHRIRALFPDQVYAEGWGTFAERLMLDQGWGGPAERVAHLKKQLENCARAIVDIRVHTSGISRDEVIRFVRDEALQDPQLAENLWQRMLTSAPQIVTYHLGYRQIDELYQRARARPGFSVRAFTDHLMAEGAIPLRHYQEP